MSSTLSPSENERIFVPINEKGEPLTHLAVILPTNYPPVPNQSNYNDLIADQLRELSNEVSVTELSRTLDDMTGRTAMCSWGRNNEEIIDGLILEWNYYDMFDDVDWDQQKPTPIEIQKEARWYLANELTIYDFLMHLKGYNPW